MPIRLDHYASGEHSQHGEEGMVDAVFREIGVRSRTCVEFGAYDLERYSNVYSLWSNGWRALLIEGNRSRFRRLHDQHERLPPDVQRRVTISQRFVAERGEDSLDSILSEHAFPEDLDLLSIDVDGLDFHIWRGLQRFRPRLVIIEYNPTIPPHIDLVGSGRGNDVGSSARAIAQLGAEKGYSLIGCCAWNAFFVEREHAHRFEAADDLEALFDSSFIRYAMQSYNGEVFFSSPLHIPYWPMFRCDSDAIERSGMPLGKLRPTILGVAETAARQHLRPLWRWYRQVRGVD